MGAHRQWWMPFRQPFLTPSEWFINNSSSSRIKIIKRLFYWFIQNQAQVLLPCPFRKGSLTLIGQIHISHAIRVANGSPLWWCLLLSCIGGRWYFMYYSYHGKDTEGFFVPARTLIGVKLFLIQIHKCESHLLPLLPVTCHYTQFPGPKRLKNHGGESEGFSLVGYLEGKCQ